MIGRRVPLTSQRQEVVVVQHLVPVPEPAADWLAVLTMSTPDVEGQDEFTELAERVAVTLEFLDADGEPLPGSVPPIGTIGFVPDGPGASSGMPSTVSIASRATPPGRRSMGTGPRHDTIVDSIPTRVGPPSTTASIRVSSSLSTCAASVGLMRPERLAEGATIGNPAACSREWASSCEGTRSATLSSPLMRAE